MHGWGFPRTVTTKSVHDDTASLVTEPSSVMQCHSSVDRFKRYHTVCYPAQQIGR